MLGGRAGDPAGLSEGRRPAESKRLTDAFAQKLTNGLKLVSTLVNGPDFQDD
jgi:hypothetical protein